MKRYLAMVMVAVCACAMCVVLAGCGSGGASSSAQQSSAASSAAASSAASSATAASTGSLQPAANVSPADINPGAHDIWRLNGDASAEGIRFEKAENEAGLAFIRVSANGEDGDGEYNLIITDEKHLRTPMSTAPKIDIVFYDNANCYDYVTGNWYTRTGA